MAGTKRVCIVGGGSSGLTSIKACLEEGLEPVCFEKTDQLGGLWRYRDDDSDGLASVMRSTIINSSKEMSAYSDFPPPKEFPNYMHNSYMIRYIEMYAEKFDLGQHIRYRHEILKVVENHDFDETGRWKVTIRDIDKNISFDDVYDGVMVYLSTRRGCWIIHRVGPNGMPFDATFLKRSWNTIWRSIPYSLLCYLSENYINNRFNHEIYQIKPKHRIFGQHPMVNDALPNRILSGTVELKGNIKAFTEKGVIFEEEEEEREADVIILATGYKIQFPFIDEKILSIENNNVDLYKYVIPPKLKHPSLAFIALAQPVGALFPIGEIQARWFALLMSKKAKLPPFGDMMADIKKKRADMAKRYFESPRNTIQIDWIPYMDEVSSLINAKPKLFNILLTDPGFFWHCVFGPCLPYQYRLNGPHPWPDARKTIMTYKDRVHYALKTRYSSRTKEVVQSPGFLKLVTSFLFLILLAFILSVLF
ncbi:dimethylaniline monooxygenase [N-oxide-forming] 5-like [Limulus polyphemus]|uniref:Flavin-containing monooxygenase n=1 Tax=Limulus polyphemus TaxID=6850 RepID=A0ABM1BXA7_LIMPO|nr:dimethylaniline monooxygenase [N-oxide-forming] 5-like [Limulus polyphemus]